MTELDFDELDKAVSSLMTNVKPSKDQTSPVAASETQDTVEKVASDPELDDHSVPRDEPGQVDEQSSSVELEPVEPAVDDTGVSSEVTAEETAVVPAQPSVAIKRRGQFMDMKHPSADMNTPQPVRPPASRQGVTLSPVSKDLTNQVANTQPVAAPVPASSEALIESSAPKKEAPIDEISDQLDTIVFDASADEQSAELASPFLPDAKVEKRPLGATAPTGDAVAPTTSAPLPELPKELHESLMAFESDTTEGTSAKSTSETSQELTDEHSDAKPDTATTEVEDTPKVTAESDRDADEAELADTVPPVSTLSAAASIPPQYKARESSETNGMEALPAQSLYDNPTDAAPLETHQKKSHWAVLLIIVTIVVLGSAVGAALYLYQTGAL